MGERSGQAGIEYAALVALVGVVLGSAAALTSGGLGRSVQRAIERGICTVAESRCPAIRAAGLPSDLEPCPVARREDNGELSLDVGIARLAARLGLAVERRSDGRVRVSFVDGGRAGVGAGVGAHLRLGHLGASAEASVEGGVAVTAGRVWVLKDRAAAERFIARYGESQQPVGRLRRDLDLLCPICAALAGSPESPPEPDERWLAGGPAAGASLGIALGPGSAGVEALLRGAVGRRVRRDGTTWFARIDDQALGFADLFGRGADAQAESHPVASFEFDRHGNPVRFGLVLERRESSRRVSRLPRRLRAIVGSAGQGIGQVVEDEAAIDLRDPAARAAVMLALREHRSADGRLRIGDPALLSDAVRRFATRTLRLWNLRRGGFRVGAGASLGLKLGLDAQSRDDSQRLVAVRTRLPGLGWLPRADCLAE